eukprot:CAMPEP_0179908970 /NCGR_PEP_ID=MMETSP0982-20121206/44948_1 /TAXON_ID=483367 /ORGANISM="non described non described, Strain CCMP 2436" /LENGTH=48 /DNA_ID= /DNA_START= /DNA_END= /DNA_ORIENTATION=
MTSIIDNTTCKSVDLTAKANQDVKLYGCNTYRRNMADDLVFGPLEDAL